MKTYIPQKITCISKYIACICFALALSIALLAGCRGKKTAHSVDLDGMHIELPDTLRVGMLNSPTTYFDYRGTPMGYDYELMERFAKFYGIEFKVEVGGTVSEMTQWLDEGKIDLLASPVPVTTEFQDRAILCGPRNVSTQVLVQSEKAPKDSLVKDVTDLVGREVFVQKDSKYFYRMQNLDQEIGGGIHINVLDRDTISDDDLLSMVWKRQIPLTVVDSDVAEAAISYYPGLDISVKVSLEQYSRWAVAPTDTGLAKVLDDWFADEKNDNSDLFRRYYRLSKLEFIEQPNAGYDDIRSLRLAGGRVSAYDPIFKEAAKRNGLDWRLLAAVAYVESHFDPNVKSWAGALGIMQVMPRTARSYGYSPEEMLDAEKCVEVAAKTIAQLDNMLKSKVPDRGERAKFILACYNAGPGHITDAMALASKYGMDATRWEGNVEQAVSLKSKPAYYRDPVVKNGYFRAKETVNFVRKVQTAYEVFQQA